MIYKFAFVFLIGFLLINNVVNSQDVDADKDTDTDKDDAEDAIDAAAEEALTVESIKTLNGADFYDPNWTPFNNMVSALRGYNIRTGDPLNEKSDPGFGGQIFVPVVVNNEKRMELAVGITASDLTSCKRTLKSSSFTSLRSLSDFVAGTSSSGWDLQIGTETEVTAGVDIGVASVSATTTIPKPFERAWGSSKQFSDLKDFFSERKGFVSISTGTCIMYEMKIDLFDLPPFTDMFKKAVRALHDATTTVERTHVFQQFSKEYGTHFLVRSQLGATWSFMTKYESDVRNDMGATTLQNCNFVNGAKVFGVQVEKDSSGCSDADKSKLLGDFRDSVHSTIITRGSRPTDIADWVTQDFTPVPLQFTLSPIINLFQEKYISHLGLPDKNELKASKYIRSWFVPMYFSFCESMGMVCDIDEGCGIDDKCPIDTTCVDNVDKHECSQWSVWKCSCTKNNVQARTRECTGCNGKTNEERTKTGCTRPADCSDDTTVKPCETLHTTWTSAIGFEELMKHFLDCGTNKILRGFVLKEQGTGENKKIQYEYVCCPAPGECSIISYDATFPNAGSQTSLLLGPTCSKRDSFLNSFQLMKENDIYAYKFSCCQHSTRIPGATFEYHTLPTPSGASGDSSESLDAVVVINLVHQQLNCFKAYMKKFDLFFGDSFHYQYNCVFVGR